MDKKLMKRLIALVLTGGILISSTGVYTALAASEEYTTSEYTSALVGSDETVTTDQETSAPQSSESTTSGTTETETTTEKETEAESTTADVQKPATVVTPETTVAPETTTKPPVVEEEHAENPSDNKGTFQWVGVNGTADMGSEENPYNVSSVEHFLAMNVIINDTGNSNKYFMLTTDLNFNDTVIDSYLLDTQAASGMEGSLVSVNPTLSSSSVFFHFDGNNKKIYNLNIENGEHAALSIFGYVNSSSTITNLTVNNTNIVNTYGDAQAAGIILKNEGTVKDCNFTIITIDTTASTTKAESFYPTDDASLRVYSGTAIVVDNSGVIDNETEYDSSERLVLAENVTIRTSRPYAGVVVAQNRGKINKVRMRFFTVAGSSDKSDYVGGFAGTNMTARTSSATGMYYCEIQTHTDNGGVTGADKIGYLVGYNTGRIRYATVVGKHKSSEKATLSDYDLLVYGGNAAGGVVGENTGDVQRCTALDIGVYFADVADGTIYGGIVGTTNYGVRNCIATGSTAGTGSAHEITRYIGGIVGYGDTSSNFSVENCYALVKIIDSKVPLGAIVGFNGDTAYQDNKIRNVFYSSIISSRPSPVSFGGAGENEGDLTFSKPYALAYYDDWAGYHNTISANTSDFAFTGWGDADFSVTGTFEGTQNTSYYSLSGLNTTSISYQLVSAGKHDKTVVNYGVDITIPAEIGASKEKTVLEKEPMEFGILNSSNMYTTSSPTGSGTKSDPFRLHNPDINFLYHAPAAHFVADTQLASVGWVVNSTYLTVPSATFWGTVDFKNMTLDYESETPLFKGIYGSRDDSLANNNSETHKSTPADDAATNLLNGVVENITIQIDAYTVNKTISNMFGNICNATVKKSVITFNENSTVIASEANSGLFAKAVYGNSYLYGCYVDSHYSANGTATSKIETNLDGTAGFIGTVDAEKAIIDNCGVDIVVSSSKSNTKNTALFIGNIKSLDGGYIQNCYATGGLVRSGGSFDSSSCYLFAGSIASSSTQIYNSFFSPAYLYANSTLEGVSAGIKAGSFTGLCKAWSFVAQTTGTQTWGDITLKVSAASDFAYVATIENMDRFDVSDTSKVSQYFEATTSNETTLSPGSIYWYGRVGLSYTFAGESGASAVLTVRHNTTGLVAKLTVFNSTELDIDTDGYYLIKTPMDLYYLSDHQDELVSGSATDYVYSDTNSKIKLAADIDMSGHSIEPIGSKIVFKGQFVAGKDTDGSYFTISNLTFTNDNIDQALFSNVQGAVIKGVHLDNASITGSAHTGALVGTVQDSVTIEDCKVTNSSISGTNDVGALVGGVQNKDDSAGANAVVIKNCSVEKTTVTSTNSEGNFAYIGGIIGSVGVSNTDAKNAEITNCKVIDCEISAAARGIGGIVGCARNNKTTITSCQVTGTTLTCTGTNGFAYASLGGIAGLYGGSSISKCTVEDSAITGECAAGIVTRLTNEAGTTSSISECTVTNSVITSDTIAGGILSQVSTYATSSCYGDKVIAGCKVSADTTVKALVAGGIIGNIQQFSDKNLTVSNCTNLGTIETTGKKGSIGDGAGGIIGRISTGMGTSGIQVTGCLSQGKLVGNSNLGGIIGINNANVHTGANKLVNNCYVTSEFSTKNLAVSKGLVVGFVGYASKNNVANVAEKVVYSSLDTKAHLFGNLDEALQTGGFDMNKGADQTRGITVDLTKSYTNATAQKRYLPYYMHSIVGYNDSMMGNTNVIELKTDFHVGYASYDGFGTQLKDPNGEDYIYKGTSLPMTGTASALTKYTVPRFSVGNLPVLTGTDGNDFAVPSSNIFSTTASSSKILVGCEDAQGKASATYNKLTDVSIQTFNKKCQAVVKTTYTGIINGETVTFDVGFTVIVRGEHAFDGLGTIDDPFMIYEAEDLLSIKQHHDNPTEKDDYLSNPAYYYEAYYQVMNDIDMSEELATQSMSFAPIGTADEPFKGHIFSTPGNQFAIQNLFIDNPESSDDYAYSLYYEKTDADGNKISSYSDALGVFGYTDGAEILDLKLENVSYSSVPGESNRFLGIKTGALVGVATNTTIQNVEVTGTVNININGSFGGRAGAIGGIVGQANNGVILSDVAVRGTGNDNRASIAGMYQVGGIVGTAADTTGGSITNAVVENASIINSATSGVSIAGGIAGQYSGIITGTPAVTDDEGNVVTDEIRVTLNNVSVTGTVVGGVVGSGNINNLASGGCDLTIKNVDVKATNIEVTESVRTDASAGINGIAGGILGTSHESYHYLIEDCTVGSDTTVISANCAGGIVGKAENRGSGTLQTETSLFIRDCSALASVSQTNAPTTDTLSLGDTVKRNTGAGAVIGVITTNAFVMNQTTKAPQIQIKNVTAGGNVSGTFNVGGIVGEFASVQAELYLLTDSIIYDCVITARLTASPLDKATKRFGVILGSVEGNQYNENNPNEQIEARQAPFPETMVDGVTTIEYKSKIVDKIFYSSYTAGNYDLYGISEIKNYQGPDINNNIEMTAGVSLGIDIFEIDENQDGETDRIVYPGIYDINKLMYNYPAGKDESGNNRYIEIPLSIVPIRDGNNAAAQYQWFGEAEYVFAKSFRNHIEAAGGNPNPFGFTIEGEEFALAENGIQSATGEVFDVIPNPDESMGVDITKQPYKITFKAFGADQMVFTYTNGLQIAISVTAGAKVNGDGTAEEPFEVPDAAVLGTMVPILAANGSYHFIQTQDIVIKETDVLLSNEIFTSNYDGGNHSITNYNVESSSTPVGIFGHLKGGSVSNLTLIGCNVNGGDCDQGTGIVAGAVTDGATISNVKVQNSTVTSNVGPVGGAVGIISGETTLENIEVTGSKVTSDKGSAGGIVGTITESTVTVTAPYVADTVITAGSLTDEGIFEGGNSNLTSGAGKEDIAGGIVAQGLGTITGAEPTIDDEDNTVYKNTVENVTVQALISGGAVGAVYKTNIADSGIVERTLSLDGVRVSETNVIAKSKDDTTASSGAGLLGIARNTTNVTLDDCYVTKTTEASTVASSGGVSYAAGAVAQVNDEVLSLNVIDTESYASVTASEAGKDGTVYASGLVGYVNNEPSILTIDGSVAGGKITGKAMKTYVAGVIGGFAESINTEITTSLFKNGVISAEVECQDGTSANPSNKSVHRYGKFIARYGADMFKEANFSAMFENNYYSTYPQDISFFSSESGESAYESLITEEMFKDINEQGNLVLSDDINSDSWNSVAITAGIGSESYLYAGLNKYAELPYGSEANGRTAVAAGGFSLVETAADEEGNAISCIELVGDIVGIENEETGKTDKFRLIVKPTAYGAEMLVAEYTCGLKTTAQIISVEIKGTGTKDDPYLISTPTQLRVVAYLAVGNKHFRQINDIDLSDSFNANGTKTDKFIHYNSGKFYAPIGTASAPFDGVYDGQGYKITGLKINREKENNLGLFGVVKQNGTLVPEIRNVHLELMAPDKTATKANGIIGNENIGGIAGSIVNASVVNCSVAVGNVTGKNNVGGIVGNFTSSKVENCFTQSDVNAFGNSGSYAGGIVGYVTDAVNFQESKISGCFAAGSIYATPTSTTGINDKSNAAGIVSYVALSTDLKIENCLFTGTTASGLGIFAGAGAQNMKLTVRNCIDAGQNVAMAAGDIFDKITNAVAPTITGTNTIENIYYDSSLLKVDTETYADTNALYTALPTSVLTGGKSESVSLSDENWDIAEGFYPVPKVSGIKVVNYNADGQAIDENGEVIDNVVTYLENMAEEPDKYSSAYAKFLSAPVQTSEEEECSDINDLFAYGAGLVYPVTLLTYIDGSYVTYSSSIFDTTDTVLYDSDKLKAFDIKLYGAPKYDEQGNPRIEADGKYPVDAETGAIISNKNVDLLFGDDKDVNGVKYTSVYRNIFDTTKNIAEKAELEELPSKNTHVNAGAAAGTVFANGEAYYNAQVPVIFATAEIDGVEVHRDIKIPLSYGTTYCIATQRQLYALGKADYELVEGTKFSNYYGSTYNYKLITDIDCGDNPTTFTPIGSDVASGYTGQFDGSGHTIKNLKIKQTGSDCVGMFSKISKDYNRNVDPFIKNLTLENATVEAISTVTGNVVTGGNYVGTLVGHVMNSGVTIENCHAIGTVEYEYEYEKDEEGNVLTDENGDPVVKVDEEGNPVIALDDKDNPIVKDYHGTVEGTGSYVGGLIGKVDYSSDIITKCSSSVKVTGSKDAVGGLIGESGGTVTSCYATGNVICDELTDGNICGVGGLIGIMSNGTVKQSFASGNVEVKAFNTNDIYNHVKAGQFGIGGFVGYVAEMKHETNNTDITTEVITECFSGGNVLFGSANDTSAVRPYSSKVIVGIGGFSGINREKIAESYSSAAVQVTLGDIVDSNSGAVYGVGIGGVAGVALEGVSEVYSSGSVAPAYKSLTNNNGNSYYGVGGTIGTTMENDPKDTTKYQYCYFDRWTNTDPNLTSIGGRDDNGDARSLTTAMLTSGKRPSVGQWSNEVWGFAENAYPYLLSLLNEKADDYIKANAILSVVCVDVADDDVSAKTGAGLTQGLTVPEEFTYRTYDENGNEETVTYKLALFNATTEGKIAAPTRTKNVQEYVDITLYVDDEDLKDKAVRVYRRLCADMKGTFEQPYLIGSDEDLKHVNMTANELAEARDTYTGFYDQWATPIVAGGTPIDPDGVEITIKNIENGDCALDADGKPISGVVHYQLMSNVSAEKVGSISDAAESYSFAMSDVDEDGNEKQQDVSVKYQGFMFNGNGYAIRNVTTAGYYFRNIGANSMITNMIFDKFTFTDSYSAIVGTNEGTLQDVYVRAEIGGEDKDVSDVAGLVHTNKGTIDGCVVDATISGATENVGVLAVKNSGIIKNSGTAGTLDTTAGNAVINIGAFVAENSGSIRNSFSMADVDVNTAAGADVQNVSGFVAVNSGIIDSSYTRSAISFAAEPALTNTVASLVGKIASVPEGVTEPVTNSYAAGLLGYYCYGSIGLEATDENYVPAQDSILFGAVPSDMPKLSSVYVDKSLAGEKSDDSFKYSASLSRIMSLQHMPELTYVADDPETADIDEERGFIAGDSSELVLPTLGSILNAENHKVVDDEGNLIYVDTRDTDNIVTYTLYTETVQNEDGTTSTIRKYRSSEVDENGENLVYLADDVDNVWNDVNGNNEVEENEIVVSVDDLELQYSIFLADKTIIRNYDVIKAYSKISSMVLKTAQSQYADRLVSGSSGTNIYETNLNSKLSTTSGVNFNPISSERRIIGIDNTNNILQTYSVSGQESIVVNYAKPVTLSRGMEINPQLLIDVAVSVSASQQLNPNFRSGIGTADNPYVIMNRESLMSLHYYGSESDLYFVLGNDIDMSEVDDFQIHVFTAHLNDPESAGGSTAQYTIKNFTSTAGDGGLFGVVEDAVINNVALTGTVESGEMYVGALADEIRGTVVMDSEGNVTGGSRITNCVVSADVRSTVTEGYSAAGVLAGAVSGNSVVDNDGNTHYGVVISGIVTTGNVEATTGNVGGIIGSATGATMSELVSTANVGALEGAGGIVGEMLEYSTLTNALYGGVAESRKPVVASMVNGLTISNTYFDNQLNTGEMATSTEITESGNHPGSVVIGEGMTTKACEKVFAENSTNFKTFNGGFYPVPVNVAKNIKGVDSYSSEYESYGATVALAAATMNFYAGVSEGYRGVYTSMQLVNKASDSKINVSQDETYFEYDEGENAYSIRALKFNKEKNPAIYLTIEGVNDKGETIVLAKRTICPGLVRNANISYKIIDGSESLDLANNPEILGVLIKNISVVNDFTTVINEVCTMDSAIIDGDGFYVGGMLPDGYRYSVRALRDGTTEMNVGEGDSFGSYIDIKGTDKEDENGDISTNILLELTIVEDNRPWGVNSIVNTLWN